MNRRSFLKIALLTSGVAAAGVVGLDFLKMSDASVKSVGMQPQSTVAINSAWQVPHLLRRAGFGSSPGELSDYATLGFSGSIDRLLNYDSIDDSSLPSQPNVTMSYEKNPAKGEIVNLIEWWLDRMINTPRPLEEKITLFWHNHFATAIYKVKSPYLMFKQNDLLRSKAMGNFEDLLMGITEDPAMLIWLDGAKNRKNAPNENYGREVMEVFTTGRGYYTEDDVKAAARAFTGYTLDSDGNVHFEPRLHDASSKTFLGQTGNLGPEDVVKILANHPGTAKNIVTELFEYFAYDNPGNDTINRLTQIYANTNGNIKAIVESILTSNEFVSSQSYLAQVKSPIEFVVAALRSLGATVTPTIAASTLNNMGQLPFDPPSVFGWPSGLAWINTSSILDRINFPLTIQDPTNVPSTPSDNYTEEIARVIFQDGLPQEVIQSVQSSTNAITDPQDKLRDTLRLIMASPFYNLN